MRALWGVVVLVGCGACGEAAEPPQDVVPSEAGALPCERDPRFTASVTGDQTSVSHRLDQVASSVRLFAEVRTFDGLPPLAVQFGDYALRVLDDLTVCVDSAPAP